MNAIYTTIEKQIKSVASRLLVVGYEFYITPNTATFHSISLKSDAEKLQSAFLNSFSKVELTDNSLFEAGDNTFEVTIYHAI